MVVLTTPPAVLVLALLHLVPNLRPVCAPLEGWDRIATFALVAALGTVAAVATFTSLVRLLLIERLLDACPALIDPRLMQRVDALARTLGVRAPSLRVIRTDGLLAVTGGLRQRCLVLSTGMLDRLD